MSAGPLQPFEGPAGASPTTFEYAGTSRVALFGGVVIGVVTFGAVLAFIAGITPLALVLLVGAAAASAFVVPRVLASSRWDNAKLKIERYPLQLGDSVGIRVEQRARGAKAPPDQQVAITFELKCTEKVTYTVGTDTRHKTHTAAELTWTAPGELVAGTYIADTVLQVPVDRGAPTFERDHNQVQWELTMKTADPLPTFGRSFDVVVIAVIAEGFQQRIPDSVQDT